MANYCKLCPITTVYPKFVPPTGPTTAKIYIVGMCPGREEIAEGIPFSGDAGKVLKSAVKEVGFDYDTDFRIFNVVNCRTTQPDNRNRNRDPYPDEIEYCKKLVYTDIKATNPSLILVLGKTAASAFLDVNAYGSVRELVEDKSLTFEGIPLRVGYHPSYIVRNGGTESTEHKKYVTFFRQFKEKIPLTYLEDMKSLKVLSPTEFLTTDFPQDKLGFDIETSSLDVTHTDTTICGLGFADLEGNGYYVYLRNKKDFLLIHKKLIELVKTKELHVFNFSFEGTALATQLQIHPYEWNMIDARQTALVMGKKGGLKSIAAGMNYPDWEASMSAILEIINNIYKLIVKGKKEPNELRALKTSWDEFKSYLDNKETDKAVKKLKKEKKELEEKSEESLEEDMPYEDLPAPTKPTDTPISLTEQVDILLNLYNKPEAIITAEQAREVLVDQASKKIKRMFFDIVPINIVSEYCAFDAFAAIKIHHTLWNQMDYKQKKAVGYFNEHSELAASIESSGVGWNLEKARYLHKFYLDEMTKALKDLVTTEKFLSALDLSPHEQIKLKSCTTLDEIKKYFNPQSTHKTTRDLFNKAMNNPITRKVYLLYLLYTETSSTLPTVFSKIKEDFANILRGASDGEDIKELNEKKRRWVKASDDKILRLIEIYDKEAVKLNEGLDLQRERTKYKHNIRPNFKGKDFYLPLLHDFDFPSMKEDNVIFLYEAFTKIAGVNIDDESTWTPEFEILYFFRLYKKITKSFTSYLWGTVGMKESAYLIKDYQNNLFCPPRITTEWKPIILNNIMLDKRLPIVSWKFNVNGAETNRWRSGYHLWPWQCELQDLKISRFENGLLAHCDYSQMEVRVIAALAHEETLLEAYKQGKDIHRYMASKIFNRPEEEITDTERRYSKTLTFSVIYGKGISGIAKDNFHGDVKKAEDLYNGFFNGFPGIDDFKNQGHRKIDDGEVYVESLLGEMIPLMGNKHGLNTSINQLKRLVVNYPVQSTASHLTAIGINRVNKDAYKQKMLIRAFGFTHDAGDFDFSAEYFFAFIELLLLHMQENINEEFGIPVKIDMEIGKTGDQMLGLKIKSIDKEKLIAKFEGSRKALEGVEEQFKKVNMNYEINITGSKDEYISKENLFLVKRAYSENIGKTVEHLEGEMIVYNPKGDKNVE